MPAAAHGTRGRSNVKRARNRVVHVSGRGPFLQGQAAVPGVAAVHSRSGELALAECPGCGEDHEVPLGEEESVSAPFGCVASRRMAVAVARDEAGARKR